MKNIKSAVANYASKVQRSEVCCNSTELMDRWMNPPPDAQEPCCGDLSSRPPIFALVNSTSESINTDTYTLPKPLCRDGIELRIINRVNNTNALDNLNLIFYIDGVGNQLTLNNSDTFTIYEGQQIYFQLITDANDLIYCHDAEIDIVNVTCGVRYNNAAILSINYDNTCDVCPAIIPSVISTEKTYNIFQFTNTTSNSIHYEFINVIANTFNACFNLGIWTTASPNVQVDPDYYLIQLGIGIPIVITIPPGQSMWLKAWVDDPCAIDASYDIQAAYQSQCTGIPFTWYVRFLSP